MIRKWSYIIKSKKYEVDEVLKILSDNKAIKLVNYKNKVGNIIQFYKPTNKTFEYLSKYTYKSKYKKSKYIYKYDYLTNGRAIYTSDNGEVMVNLTVLNYLLKQKGL